MGARNSVANELKLLHHDLASARRSLSRFKLSLPQCNVPGIFKCMLCRLNGFPTIFVY